MDLGIIGFGLTVTLALLVIGIRTESQIAHLFSFVSGMFLIGEAMSENVPRLLIWSFALLALYPAIQLKALRSVLGSNKEEVKEEK
jgi:hypothetical protein